MASETPTDLGKVRRRRLADAVREIKIASAERSDVVVEMKEADRARLEILAQGLEPVFAEVPADDERFDFALSSGLQPRLWIDATAHVIMGKDRRQYRFVRDTRLGRVILAESAQSEPIEKAVTKYIAERIYERELALSDDDIIYRAGIAQRAEEVELRKNTEALKTTMQKLKAQQPSLLTLQQQEEGIRRPDMSRFQPVHDDAMVPMAAKDRTSKIDVPTLVWTLLAVFIVGGFLLLRFQDLIFGAP